MVLREFVTAWRFAASPTMRSPLLVNATTDGVVRLPSEFSRTSGSPPSMTAMQELVVPKSMPITFAIKLFPSFSFSSSLRLLQHAKCHKAGHKINWLMDNNLHRFLAL